ncbi:hypothetical protein Mgra_00008955, partial [Meloidogyne graminicola]
MDANSPTWRNQIEGQVNLHEAFAKNTAVRPRGWHLPEKHVLINDKPMSASVFNK